MRAVASLLCLASLVACGGCIRGKANVAQLPLNFQIVGGDDKPRTPLVGPRWHRVEPGMSKDDVIHFVGEPTRRDYEGHFTNGSVETWYYDSYNMRDGSFDPHYVRFDRGRVVYSAFDEKRLKEEQAKETAAARKKRVDRIVPPDVGFKCDSNEQCQSKNCLNGFCAGPNGCTRGAGADCTGDADCCSLKCIAGRFCK